MDLKNKKLVFLGDSITYGSGTSGTEKRYDNLIKEHFGAAEAINYAISGTRIAYQKKPSDKSQFDLTFCGRIWTMDKSADAVFIMGGINDYLHGDATIGHPGDTDKYTFYGAVEYLCKTARELYPDSTLFFLVPAHCIGDGKRSMNENLPPEAESNELIKYVDVIKEIAPKYGFHTLSLYDNLKIDPNIPEDMEKYTTDGIHFNDAGHKAIADLVIKFVESIND